MLVLYRVITYLLLPVAIFFGLISLIMLFAAFINPPLLIAVFMIACIVIYIFASFSFFNKAIIAQTYCKPSLRDWIRVNAFVTIAFAVWMLVQTIAVVIKPALLEESIKVQLANTPNLPAGFPEDKMVSIMKGFLYFFFFLAIVLLVHVTLTFKYLKQYSQAFNKDNIA